MVGYMDPCSVAMLCTELLRVWLINCRDRLCQVALGNVAAQGIPNLHLFATILWAEVYITHPSRIAEMPL